MKIIIVILLFAIVVSLFASLFFIYKDKGQSNRAVKALTVRIVLSGLVFVLLILSYLFGLIPGTPGSP